MALENVIIQECDYDCEGITDKDPFIDYCEL